MKFNFQPHFNYADIRKGLILPKEPNIELAEFIGILTGDGYLGAYPQKYDYRIEIAGHKELDYEYLTNYVTSLIKYLFNITPTFQFRNDQNVMNLRISSKTLVKFIESIGFPTGKKGQIGIPNWIIKNEDYFLAFTRGLFDTDGCLTLKKGRAKKRKYEPCICFASASKLLRDLIYSFLINKGFNVCKYISNREEGTTYRIQIFKKDNIPNWMNLIGFKNQKHLSKYKKLSGNGRI